MDTSNFVLVGAITAAVVGLAIALVVHDQREWDRFATAHHCKVVGHMDGSVAPSFGVSASGNATVGTVVIPDKTGYACDDGVTYWR